MSDYFPLEVIEEILQRLPLKSLVKFISVCKAWKSIIKNRVFITSHHQHLQCNPTNSSLFFHLHQHRYHTVEGEFFSLYSNDDDATGDSLSFFKFPLNRSHPANSWTVVGTCNGLVCLADYYFYSNDGEVVIWNPSIYRYLILPKPSLKFETSVYSGFGFDSHNHDFKVVRFSIGAALFEEATPQVEIYSLAAHSWRTIHAAPFPFGTVYIEDKFVNGVLHWRARRKINGMCHYFILTFDLVEERFGELMLPQYLKEVQKPWKILSGGNLLALVANNSVSPSEQISYSIWVMKEYGAVESWTQLLHFDMRRYDDLRRVLALRNIEEVVIVTWSDEITFQDPVKGLVKKISHIPGIFYFVGDHLESLFLINEKNSKAYLPH